MKNLHELLPDFNFDINLFHDASEDTETLTNNSSTILDYFNSSC